MLMRALARRIIIGFGPGVVAAATRGEAAAQSTYRCKDVRIAATDTAQLTDVNTLGRYWEDA
jgi:hypothetical protein